MEKVTFTLKNLEIVKIFNSFNKLTGSTGGSAEFKLSMAIDKNVLKPLTEAIDLVQKPSEGIVEYSTKYHKMLQEVDSLDIPLKEKQEKVQKELEVLNEEYKEEVENRHKQLVDFEKILVETMEVDLYPLSTDDILSSAKSVDSKVFTSEDFENLLLLVK